MNLTWINLLIVASIAWRLASLLANEYGPFWMFRHFRRRAKRLTRKNKFFHRLHFSQAVECEWCNGLWIALPIIAAWWYWGDMVLTILLPFAISAWVIVIKLVVQTLENICVYFDNLNKQFKK